MAKRFKKTFLIFTSILLGILIFAKIMGLLFSGGELGSDGNDFAILIFIFVYYIAVFKDSFNHLSISGVTRKTFCLANIIFIIFTALVSEVTIIIFMALQRLFGNHPNFIIEMIFHNCTDFQRLLLGFSIAVLASFVGWLFSLLTYKYGNLMILVIIFVPQILMTIIGAIIDYYGKTQSFYYYLSYYFGFADGMTPYNTILNMLLTAVAVGAINWLLMRRLPVKV